MDEHKITALPESLNDSFNEIFSMPKIGDKYTMAGVKKLPNGQFITDCVQGDETVFVYNVQSYSLKEDKRFMHADDVEETHVRGDWERE